MFPRNCSGLNVGDDCYPGQVKPYSHCLDDDGGDDRTHADTGNQLLALVKKRSQSRVKSSWSKDEIHAYMMAHPQRAHFTGLFQEGGFRTGMEVGVAAGRFSELFLTRMNDTIPDWSWHMVEPFPNAEYVARFPKASSGDVLPAPGITSWDDRGIGKSVDKHFYKHLSTDPSFVAQVSDKSLDFLYLDGAHDYENVKRELLLLFSKVRPGGVLAGHDYCNYGEEALGCKGCQDIPQCQAYTEFGVAAGKGEGRAMNQNGVVRAVQEFLVETHPELELQHTNEDFTRASLDQDGMDYDLVITSTRNPSWFFVIPE